MFQVVNVLVSNNGEHVAGCDHVHWRSVRTHKTTPNVSLSDVLGMRDFWVITCQMSIVVIVRRILSIIFTCSLLLMSDCGLLLEFVLLIAGTMWALYSQILRIDPGRRLEMTPWLTNRLSRRGSMQWFVDKATNPWDHGGHAWVVLKCFASE